MISTEDLIDFEALKAMLGYEDDRSIKKWCKTNKIPLIKLGLKDYVMSNILFQYIDNQLVIFVKENEIKDRNNSTYSPTNEIISKYLKKYESNSKKTHPSKQTKT